MAECLDDFVKISVAGATVFHGSNLDVLPFMADNSVDSIVTDPPYELGFMGKKWDSSGIAYSVELWSECLRVLKPGGHLLAFGGSRTWHRLAVAIEDAGFDVRDSIAWLYGSGFPKSHDVSKAIDKAAGAERDEWPTLPMQEKGEVGEISKNRRCAICLKALASGNPCVCDRSSEAITDDAKKWQGWGTALKPAFEPVVVARKPLVGTVAENVLAWGVGGLNIDASRITAEDAPEGRSRHGGGIAGNGTSFELPDSISSMPAGRWPANVAFDEYTASLLPESGPTGNGKVSGFRKGGGDGVSVGLAGKKNAADGFSDSGSVSRFFYVSKANKRDRNEGLEELPEVRHSDRNKTDGVGGDNPRNRTNQAKQNFHPTVKPTDLMRYLIKLVTPPDGIVLDPFTGSGSTGKAALLDGFQFIGIELTDDYLPIIQGRLQWAVDQRENNLNEVEKQEKETLF